jgi:hypothetical protein
MTAHEILLRTMAAVSIFEKHQRKWSANPAAVMTLLDSAGITSRDVWFSEAIAERVTAIDATIPRAKRGADEAAEWLFGPAGALYPNLMIAKD